MIKLEPDLNTAGIQQRRIATFVFATSQFDVSLSSSHFLIHSLSHLHCTGSCHISPHAKLQQE